jgi:hypothetical protein
MSYYDASDVTVVPVTMITAVHATVHYEQGDEPMQRSADEWAVVDDHEYVPANVEGPYKNKTLPYMLNMQSRMTCNFLQ